MKALKKNKRTQAFVANFHYNQEHASFCDDQGAIDGLAADVLDVTDSRNGTDKDDSNEDKGQEAVSLSIYTLADCAVAHIVARQVPQLLL